MMNGLTVTRIPDEVEQDGISYEFVTPDGDRHVHAVTNDSPLPDTRGPNMNVPDEFAAVQQAEVVNRITKQKLKAVRQYRKLVNAEAQHAVERKKRKAASRKRSTLQKASRRRNRGR